MFSMEKRDLLQGMATITGVFYINFLAFHIVLVDDMFTKVLPVGKFWFSGLNSYVWIIVLAAFGTDIFAYFTGKLFGKHKLCPSISPKKTVEGSIGGIIGSVILCGLFGWFFIPEGFVNCIIIGFAGSIISQIGDLSASVMKRKIGIKDWGTLIPGHGGVLDRIDSMLFTAPLVFYFLLFKEIVF
jgi:phosphatidate cytidylyltransferase